MFYRSARHKKSEKKSKRKLLTIHGWSNVGIPNEEYRKSRGLPDRQSAAWNDAEERALISQYLSGFSYSEIAEYHMRTVLAIQMRIDRIGARK